MKTHKIKVELPDATEIVRGLDARSLHPALVKAERTVEDAERALKQRRDELADAEKLVAALPARVQRGEARADALRAAIIDRDAKGMLVVAADVALKEAKERIPVEERAAKAAVDREFVKRAEVLERVVAEIRPLLEELRGLAFALAGAKGDGGMLCLDWPMGLNDEMQMRVRAMVPHPEPQFNRGQS